MLSPSGRRALLRAVGDQITWTFIDLDAGTARAVPALTGYPPLPYAIYAPGVRWLSFFPSDSPKVDPGATMVGLDLETGIVRPELTFQVAQTYYGILNFTTLGSSPDGRYVAVDDFGSNYPQFWLVDAAQGTARLYANRIAASFSPGGRALVVSAPVEGQNGKLWRTFVMTVDGQDGQPFAESWGRAGIWVPSALAR
jgi:hypothetical protein